MIDLKALARSAEQADGDCVVTRRWLRQVLGELRMARAAAGHARAAELDVGLTVQDIEPRRGATIVGVDYGRPA